MDDTRLGERHDRSARVITALDEGLLAALVGAAKHCVPIRDVAAVAALDRLVAVLHHVAAEATELHVLMEPHDEDLGPALEHLQGLLGERASVHVDVHPLGVTQPIGASLGDRPELFSTPVTGFSGDVPRTIVVNGTMGTPTEVRALKALSDLWGVPVLVESEGDLYQHRLTGEVTSSLLLAALRFTLTTKHSPEADIELLSRGFEGLVAPGSASEGYRATASLHEFLAEDRFVGMPDHFSACADLLERLPSHEGRTLARDLRELIQHWLRHRIWSVNYVPEMVLHDEAHSVAVDRNVASLAETLLRTGDLEEEDVFVLALAAWLHDWGHASAAVLGQLPRDPVEVRTYHGFLTAQKLAQEPTRHLIGERVDWDRPTDQDVLRERRLNEVALLSAHHQGWTSCSHEPAVDDHLPVDALSVIKGGELEAPRLSFSVDYERRFRGPAGKVARDIQHMQKLLALLRLADATDMGVHRVPDFATQHANRDVTLKTLLAQIRVQLAPESDAMKLFNSVISVCDELLGSVKGQSDWSEAKIKQKVESAAVEKGLSVWLGGVEQALKVQRNVREDPAYARSLPPEILKSSRELSKEDQLVYWAWLYATHVVRQVAYYQRHAQIRAVIPVVEETGERLRRLVVHVVPRAIDGRSTDGAELTAPVMEDVLREFGGKVKDGKFVFGGEKAEAAKAAIRTSFHDHLRIDPTPPIVRPFPIVLKDYRQSVEVRRELRQRAAVFVVGDSPAWVCVRPDGSAAAEPVLGRSGDAPHGLPLACALGGRFFGANVNGAVVVYDVTRLERSLRFPLPEDCLRGDLIGLEPTAGGFEAVIANDTTVALLKLGDPARRAEVTERFLMAETPVRALRFGQRPHIVYVAGASLRSSGGLYLGADDVIAFDAAVYGEVLFVTALASSGKVHETRRYSRDAVDGSLRVVGEPVETTLHEPLDDVYIVHERGWPTAAQVLTIGPRGINLARIEAAR